MASPLRKVLYLQLLLLLVLAGSPLAIWMGKWIEERRTPEPVKAARAFLSELRQGYGKDEACARALARLTAAGRSLFESQARAAEEQSPRYRSPGRSCSVPAARTFHGLHERSARLVTRAGGEAVVGFDRYQADPKSYLVPGFWPTRWIITPAEVRLTEEAGGWKIAVP